MPYPNEHSVRFADPHMYDEFRRKNGAMHSDMFGKRKSIDVIYGLRTESGETTSEIQALRFPKKEWTVLQVRQWLVAHYKDYKYLRVTPAGTSKEVRVGKGMEETHNNPKLPEPEALSIQEIYEALEYFLEDEYNAVAHYAELLDRLPQDKTTKDLRDAIRHILNEEQEHAEIIFTFLPRGYVH